MALTYRFYRAARIGDGLTPATAFRSKLTDYVVQDTTGQSFWDWINDAKPVRYALCLCEPAKHAEIEADPECTPISAQLSDLASLEVWLDGPISGAPQSVRDQLEADGCSTSWALAQTTKREMFRYLSRLHVAIQDCKRLRNAEALDFFGRALTATVSSVPSQVRTRIAAWMQAKGMDTSWITGATTVRQVLHYILTNVQWGVMRLGPVSF